MNADVAPVKGAKVFEMSLEDLDQDPYASASQASHEAGPSDFALRAEYVRSEVNSLGKRTARAYSRIEKMAQVLACVEDSAWNESLSREEFNISEEGAPLEGSLAYLRGLWHEVMYKAEERRRMFWGVCITISKKKAALLEELRTIFTDKSVEEDFRALSENLDIPGTTEVLCHAHHYDCECEECE